ncbi:MAG TPA: glutathione peroxidase [Bacteroidales bacterium]|nr:glutathione peroxidase [Bacteroidales bacterium]
MKTILFSVLIIASMGLFAQTTDFYSLKATDIDGNEFSFESLKGKKVLIVNTASKCGFTPQYKELEELHQKYGDKLVIIGFPANNFMSQEPGTDEEIAEFCQKNYGVSFKMMSKISVKGDDMHPVYQWLTSKDKNGKLDSEVSWNFQKYMIDDKGQLVGYAKPKEKPFDSKIIEFITE